MTTKFYSGIPNGDLLEVDEQNQRIRWIWCNCPGEYMFRPWSGVCSPELQRNFIRTYKLKQMTPEQVFELLL